MEQTFGQKVVRRSFNPSASVVVEDIKQKHAELIDLMQAMRETANEIKNPEMGRLSSISITKLEEAAMWAVKAATA